MGHHDLVKLLLQHKADPLATDADFMTPLHKVNRLCSESGFLMAIKKGYVHPLKRVIDKKKKYTLWKH